MFLGFISSIFANIAGVGDVNPQAVVIGTDLSPIQPEWVPPNVKFEVADMLEEWNFSQKFDYIHGRMVFSWFEKRVIQSAYKYLKPGGYLEFQDAAFPFQSNKGTLASTSLEQWTNLVLDLAAKKNKDWTCASRYAKYMREAGFVDICEHWYEWPINPGSESPKLGLYVQENLVTGVEAFSTYLLDKHGMSAAEIEVMLANVRKDIKNRDIHAYLPM
jgi:SAM-dependent methyltransferase